MKDEPAELARLSNLEFEFAIKNSKYPPFLYEEEHCEIEGVVRLIISSGSA